MSRYIPDRTPQYHWQWAAGTGYTGANPCGLAGNLLTTEDFDEQWDIAESGCTDAGCGVLVLNLPAGFPSGEASSVATWGVLETVYSHITDWLTDVFPSRRIPGRKYGLYMGGRQKEPHVLTGYNTSGGTKSIPAGSFFVDAVAPFRALGFTHLWTDATEGDPALRPSGPNANNSLITAGWHVGAEFVPNDGVTYPTNQLEVVDSILSDRPHFITWDDWRDFYRQRFTRDFAPDVEVHIMARNGDTDFTVEIADELIDKGAVVGFYKGAEASCPDTIAHVAERQRSQLQQIRRSRGRSRASF